MEHTELKKETSIDWLMTQLYKKGFIKEIDGNEPIILMNQAKEMENQQKGYSEEDLKQFAFECVGNFLSNRENELEIELVNVISDRNNKLFEQFKNK